VRKKIQYYLPLHFKKEISTMGKIDSYELIHAKSRDFWWNDDYFQLLINRFNMHNIKSIADVGCGNGYLRNKLLGHLPNISKIYGIDKEKSSRTERGKEKLGEGYDSQLHGGGNEVQFEKHWERKKVRNEMYIKRCREYKYYSPGSGLFYVISGTK
jgi:hypothetical protein